MPECLLSIVVPTRDRLECAASVVAGFAASDDPRVELILHDNSSTRDLEAIVEATGDPRIRYFHISHPLTMHENFDAGISKARGTYVCAIGDDDGMIISEAVAVLDRAARAGADAVLTAVPGYAWPGTVHRVWGQYSGEVTGMDASASAPDRFDDPCQALEELFAAGLTHSLGRLPRVYQGFVSRRSLDALRAHCGTCFPGPSPDIANAVALVPFVDRIMVSSRPTVISGHSPRSGGGSGSAGTHHGRLEDQAHLPAGTIENWTDVVPRFWSGPTIYAQSAIVACKAAGASLPPVGYARLYATCLVYERSQYWGLVFEAMRHSPNSLAGLMVRTAYQSLRLLAARTINFARNAIRSRRPKRANESYPDIAAVMHECERRVLAFHARRRDTA